MIGVFMKTEKIEILDIIRSVDVITVDFYEELISKYDKKDVDFIIDSQIDDRDYLKYADYIDRIGSLWFIFRICRY